MPGQCGQVCQYDVRFWVPPRMHALQTPCRRAAVAAAQPPTALATQQLHALKRVGPAASAEEAVAQGHELVPLGASGSALPARSQRRGEEATDAPFLAVAVVGICADCEGGAVRR